MATYTSYLNLEKPTTSETFNLLKMNQNWDKIDAGVSALNSKLGKYLTTRVFNSNYDNLTTFLNDCDTILDNMPDALSLVPVGHMYYGVGQSVGLTHGGAVFAINRNSSSRALYVFNILTGVTALSYICKASGTWETSWSTIVKTN